MLMMQCLPMSTVIVDVCVVDVVVAIVDWMFVVVRVR